MTYNRETRTVKMASGESITIVTGYRAEPVTLSIPLPAGDSRDEIIANIKRQLDAAGADTRYGMLQIDADFYEPGRVIARWTP